MTQQSWSGWFENVAGYLDSASIGLPPTAAVDAVVAALESWRHGRARPQDYDGTSTVAAVRGPPSPRSRGNRRGRLDRVRAWPDRLVAGRRRQRTGRRRGLHVSAVSLSWPNPGAGTPHRWRGSLEDLPSSVDEHADLVAGRRCCRSADGRRVDVEALLEAAARHGLECCWTVTQSSGSLPLDCSRADYVVRAGYKWLLCPRGVSFPRGTPVSALMRYTCFCRLCRHAGCRVWTSIYGGPLRLAATRRPRHVAGGPRVGATHSLELLARWTWARSCPRPRARRPLPAPRSTCHWSVGHRHREPRRRRGAPVPGWCPHIGAGGTARTTCPCTTSGTTSTSPSPR